MFGIPEWFLATGFCFFLVVGIFYALAKHYTVQLPKPDCIEWKAGICNECYGWKHYDERCPYYSECHE